MTEPAKVDLRNLSDVEAKYQDTCRIDQANLGVLGVEVNLNCDALRVPDTESPASVDRKYDAAQRRLQQSVKAMTVSKA